MMNIIRKPVRKIDLVEVGDIILSKDKVNYYLVVKLQDEYAVVNLTKNVCYAYTYKTLEDLVNKNFFNEGYEVIKADSFKLVIE